jgi:pSer/pThr/pTyr-binding forkhead associated (FHA) protein
MPESKKPDEDSTLSNLMDSTTIIPGDGPQRQELHIIGLTVAIIEGQNKGVEFPITFNRMTIGRKNTDIILDDPLISRKHAEIEVLGRGYYFVKDLASSNGTLVNGVLITNQRVHPFDKIQVGGTVMTIIEK